MRVHCSYIGHAISSRYPPDGPRSKRFVAHGRAHRAGLSTTTSTRNFGWGEPDELGTMPAPMQQLASSLKIGTKQVVVEPPGGTKALGIRVRSINPSSAKVFVEKQHGGGGWPAAKPAARV